MVAFDKNFFVTQRVLLIGSSTPSVRREGTIGAQAKIIDYQDGGEILLLINSRLVDIT